MRICGLIVEYNPFHNGHQYHINKAKEITSADIMIVVMSSSFMQRGEPAIINKFIRTQASLDAGIDLVIELPFVYAVNSADYFADNAVKLLNELGVTDIVFGSESNDLTILKKAAKIAITKQFQTLVKDLVKGGNRYASACNKAYESFDIPSIDCANDILGKAYLTSIYKMNYSIESHSIKRTNEYLDDRLKTKISSATAIRKALFHKEDITNQTMMAQLLMKSEELVYLNDFFNLLKYKINTTPLNHLENIYGITEGIEYLLIKHINKVSNIDELITKTSSKRYPKTRIQRVIIYLLINLTKEEMNLIDINYIRVLGMSIKGQSYLKVLKKKTSFKIITTFSKHSNLALDIEHRASLVYSLANRNTSYLYDKEYQQQVIIKKSL